MKKMTMAEWERSAADKALDKKELAAHNRQAAKKGPKMAKMPMKGAMSPGDPKEKLKKSPTPGANSKKGQKPTSSGTIKSKKMAPKGKPY